MSTLTIRLPEDTAQRLKSLAQTRDLSMNKLMEELSAQAIAAFDVETRFRALAARGDAAQALAVLDRLDRQDADLGYTLKSAGQVGRLALAALNTPTGSTPARRPGGTTAPTS